MANELPDLHIPTGAQPLLKLKWTARAHDPSGTRAPPTNQEMAEWIASDKWEKFSDASSDGSAYDEIELDPEANKPGWTRPKYPIPPGYKGEEVSDRPQGVGLIVYGYSVCKRLKFDSVLGRSAQRHRHRRRKGAKRRGRPC